MSSQDRLRGAVIGAGPAGFYAADQLLGEGFEVDLYDVLPTPFGLVRAGVAPDHPKIKSVTRVYEKTAAKDGFRFFGGVELGADVALDVARMLVLGSEELGLTDTADHALACFAGSGVREVVILGRRGPAQAA